MCARGHPVDAADHLGGLAAPWQLGDVTWDRHYHVTLLSDQRTLAMYRSVGITDDSFHWMLTRTVLRCRRQVASVSGIAGFSASRDLASRQAPPGSNDPLRLPHPRRSPHGADRRRAVAAPVERLVGIRGVLAAVLRAKLGDAYRSVSGVHLGDDAPPVRRSTKRHQRREVRLSVRVDTRPCAHDSRRLFAVGVDLRVSQPVLAVRRAVEGLVVETTTGAESFDRVMVTTGAPLAAQLCPDLLPGNESGWSASSTSALCACRCCCVERSVATT